VVFTPFLGLKIKAFLQNKQNKLKQSYKNTTFLTKFFAILLNTDFSATIELVTTPKLLLMLGSKLKNYFTNNYRQCKYHDLC
jgi:hypothetical protein